MDMQTILPQQHNNKAIYASGQVMSTKEAKTRHIDSAAI